MKKIIASLITVLCISTILIGTTGCNLTEGQMNAISQTTGLAAAVGWIAADNPDTNEMAMVSATLDFVQTNVNQVASGKKYVQVLYPLAQEFVNTDAIPEEYEPLVLAGTRAALNGVDLLFALYPDWKDKEEISFGIVDSFIVGAKMGLSLADDDPRIIEARSMYQVQAKMFNE